ncbi:MAG: hypothetical protein IJP56_09730, partial [Synergistaceae bacterium]|nr:hypothetical protein [Synergistaceae bacterium]
MRKSKLGRSFLAAVLALTLVASGAFAATAQAPTPIESSNGGSISVTVSFDADPASVLISKATNNPALYAPEFKGLTAFTDGITANLEDLKTTASTFGTLTAGSAYSDNAIAALAQNLWAAANMATDNAVKLELGLAALT